MLPLGTPYGSEELKPPGILGHHRSRVFCVRYWINQSCSLEHDWERLSPSYTWNVKRRTWEYKSLAEILEWIMKLNSFKYPYGN